MNKNEETKWLEDIDYLSIELPKRHKNLFFNLNKDEFYNKINNLKREIQYLDNYEIQVEIGKIVALVKDAHTYINMNVRYLCPIHLYWFEEGIYIISSIDKYEKLVGCRLVEINGIKINELVNSLRKIISYENEEYFKAQFPKYLPAVELLYGLEVIDDFSSLKVTIEDIYGTSTTLEIESMLAGEISKIEKKTIGDKDEKLLPLYRQNTDKYYWFKFLEDSKVVYFKYNRCKDMDIKICDFCKELIDTIENNNVYKLVIDVRDNVGGNSTLLDNFIEYLSSNNIINKKGKLFVIVGRETFSSALLNVLALKKKTEAVFVGESTGGKPNCYGEVENMVLKNYGIKIYYSTKYYKVIEDDKAMCFLPDIKLDFSIEDYKNNVDPFLDYILELK
ncbi:S41 family peptidase [Clostridium arbusti]|uniref:S41 family peptidase n=1 Tax=Clostridium arbusti TaxID=1137848 RepID=UPI000288244A|nr:S41 family peptidase [Clostridium arbusti]